MPESPPQERSRGLELPFGTRRYGAMMFALLLLTGILGILATPGDGPATAPFFDAHVTLGAGTVGLGALALVALPSLPRSAGKVATLFMGVATIATATAGTVFLVVHDHGGGTIDRILALAGAATMALVGTPIRNRRGPPSGSVGPP